MEKDSVIVLSGGMDSVSLLYDYKERIALAVTFDYGSNHNAREIACARENCRRLGVEHLVIPLEFMGRYFNSSLLSGGDAIPEGHYTSENMKSTVVPFRNGIMLAVACGLAESRGLKKVMLAIILATMRYIPTAARGLSTRCRRPCARALMTVSAYSPPTPLSPRMKSQPAGPPPELTSH